MMENENVTTHQVDPIKLDRLLLWADALDSGTYNQTTGVLMEMSHNASTPTYCCLGVMCEILPKAGCTDDEMLQRAQYNLSQGLAEPEADINEFFGVASTYVDPSDDLMSSILDETLDTYKPYKYLDRQLFITLNDEANWDFNQIANFIRTVVQKIKESQGEPSAN